MQEKLFKTVNFTMNPYHCPSISDYLKELVKEFYCYCITNMHVVTDDLCCSAS